ncbi:transcription initiation factor TFIID subunit 4b isoform X2 [Silene latifolia]|uniref:transcription initiation factor TFIID subunit 4b isoform X2 n=1 Tax=Silene latifolia TaxID=37657 RepID=UPI003D7808CA
MDPSIMKLLEEDEDESMHSGADVEAFTAALNRDIENGAPTTQPSQPETSFSQELNQSSSQMYSQWQPSNQNDINANQCQQNKEQLEDQLPSNVGAKEHGTNVETKPDVNSHQAPSSLPMQYKAMPLDGQGNQVEQNPAQYSQPSASTHMQISGRAHPQISEQDRMHNPSQLPNTQRLNNNQPVPEQVGGPSQRQKQIPFGSLLPIILPDLDKDKAMQLQTLYTKLKRNEIPKEGFVRHMRGIVGDQMLRLAVVKMQAKNPSQQQPQQQLRLPPGTVPQNSSQQQQQQLRPPPGIVPQSMSQQQQQQLRPPPGTVTQNMSQQQQQQLRPPPGIVTQNMSQQQQQPLRPPPGIVTQNMSQQQQQPLRPPPGIVTQNMSQQQQQPLRPPPGTVTQFSDPYTFGQLPQQQANQLSGRPAIPVQGLSKQQQEHLHFSQSSFPMYGGQPFAGTNASSPSTMINQPNDTQIRHVQLQQGFGSAHNNVPKVERQTSYNDTRGVPGPTMANMPTTAMHHTSVSWQAMTSKDQGVWPPIGYVKQEPIEQGPDKQPKVSNFQSQGPSLSAQVDQGKGPGTSNDELTERQNSTMAFGSAMRTTNMTTPNSVPTQMDADTQVGSQNALASSKIATKKPISGQKKPLDSLVSSPPLPGKKQKVSGSFADQSIEHLNDVTAVSGVNLREEEEQLFSLPKDDSRVSEASRKAVQEEEDRLILQKNPLQKKLAEIMTKCGLKNLSNDVEKCLSLCVEERLRALISSLIRVSKHRVDSEKSKHSIVVNSDVREQILMINQKATEEWEKKQAEADKLRKQNEPDSSGAVDVEKEKEEARNKSLKVNKEEDDKMRTTAANVAARAAVGGDDMLSKWQLMAQARQKRDGGPEIASGSQLGRDATLKPLITSTGNVKDTRGVGKKDHSATLGTPGAMRQGGKYQENTLPPRIAPSISIKDVIAVLEREPQMAKSTLVYRLYDRSKPHAPTQ